MRSPTFHAFLGISLFFVVAGILFLNPVPFLIALPLFWIIFLDGISKYEKIAVSRELPLRRYVEGDNITVEYKLKGRGYYEIEDELMALNGFVEGEKNHRVVKRFEQFGVIPLKRIAVRSESFAGLQEHEYKIKTDGMLKIYPRIEFVRKFRIKPRRTRSLLGDYPSRRKGNGMEFRDIREYHAGDPIRRINWKATARKNEVMVNEFESERTGDTVILLDVRRFHKGSEEYERLLEHSVRAAATLVTYLSRTKNRVGLVLLENTVDWIYPTYGKRALHLVLDRLLRTRSEEISKIPFEYGKFIVSRFFPPNSFIIVISPLLSRDIDSAIVELLARGYDLLIISPNLLPDEKDLATDILKTERDIRLRRLRMYARVVDWNLEYPLTRVLMVLR